MTAANQAATLTTLANFNGTDGPLYPGVLVADANGDLFGTTDSVGDQGTVFELAKTPTGYASAPTTLASFGDTNGMTSDLVIDANGDLFGTTDQEETDTDTIFELAKTPTGYASAPTTLASFEGTNGGLSDLIIDASGDLFGRENTVTGQDSIFEFAKTPTTGYASAPTILASFDDPMNGNPSDLVLDASGDLFGTAYQESGGQGTIFELAKTATGYASAPTTLASVDWSNSGEPNANLIVDANGDLFGTTGGFFVDDASPSAEMLGYQPVFASGTVFELAKTATGYASAPTTLASFEGTGGAVPGGLIVDADGDLFGTTDSVGDQGTVFEIPKTAFFGYAEPTTLASVDWTNSGQPMGDMIADASGDLFGTTTGDSASDGTVFEITGSGFVPPGSATPAPPSWGAFDVRDLTLGIDYSASPLSNAFTSAWLPEDSVVVAARRPDAFLQTGAGSDILAAQAGGDNVLDDTGGAANVEMGGAGQDAYFFDAGRDPVSWNTLVGFHAGDFAAIFGIGPQDVAATAADGLGGPGYTGLTLRTTSESGGTAFVTLAGYSTAALTNGSLVTAFGTDPVSGREYMLVQAT